MSSRRGYTFTMLILPIITVSMLTSLARATEFSATDADFLRKQELIFQLLWDSKETPKNHPEIFERLRNYKLEDVEVACENHTHAKLLEKHLDRIRTESKDEPFAAFRDEQVDDVRLPFGVLLCAKSFDEFVTLIAWFRGKIPQIAWIHASIMAINHRKDTRGLKVPNLYEIFPHYFFETRVLLEAYRAKTGEIDGIDGRYSEYTIEANHTIDPSHPTESRNSHLKYFTDDVGLNQFYFESQNYLAFWMSCEEKYCNGIPRQLRGELYYHLHRTLLAKYELERLSVGLPRVEDIDWEQGITTGYRSRMTHLNGWPIPDREPAARVPLTKYKFLEEVKRYELRLSKAIDLAELSTASRSSKSLNEPSSFNDLCNALEGNVDSPHLKFYGSVDRLYRRLLGFAPEALEKKTSRLPVAALEMAWTSLRDPGFFRMSKRILDFGIRFKRNLPIYTPVELGFDGVRIDYVHLDKLITYFDKIESTLNHPRTRYYEDDSHKESCGAKTTVIVRQLGLNHKAFTYEIGVTSERQTKAILRIFLGPKTDIHGRELDLEDTIEQFYELDRWIVDLKQGSNKFVRSSANSPYYASELQSSEAYNRDLIRALRTSDENLTRDILRLRQRHPGLPQRFMLPRGTQSGFGVKLLICLHGLDGSKVEKLDENTLFGGLVLDGRDLAFPLDRPLSGEGLKRLRNFLVKDIKIFHDDGKNVERD